MKRAALGAVLVFLCSCSTASKRAAAYMESGLFEEAEREYAGIVRKDPQDTDAAQGLHKARESLIDRRLIESRLARIAGNPIQGLELLLQAVSREKEWNFFPAGKVAFTQEEESDLALQFGEGRVIGDLKTRRPLRSAYFLKRYQPVFQGKFAPRLEALRAKAVELGKETCREFAQQRASDKSCYNRFVARYCRYFGETPAAAAGPACGADLYRALRVKIAASGFGPEHEAAFRDALESSLKRTGWFSVDAARTAEAEVKGSYSRSYQRSLTQLSHVYIIKEPYTEYVRVQKERSIAYVENGLTRYKNESYTVDEPRERTRELDRVYRFQGWQVEQGLGFNISAEVDLGGRDVDASHSAASRERGIDHDENQPGIGLAPSRARVPDAPSWLNEQIAGFARQFQGRAETAWRDLFCRLDIPAKGFTEVGEAVQKCLRGPTNEPPALAANWYDRYFGVTVGEAADVLGTD